MNLFFKKSLLDIHSLSKEEFIFLLDSSKKFKRLKAEKKKHRLLEGYNIVLIFEKDSTRTRCSFEVASFDLGMGVTYLGSNSSSQINKKESIKDSARVLRGFYDCIAFRGFKQEAVAELCKYSEIPTYNGLTDTWHPTQMLADILTMQENSTKELEEIGCAFVGDGRSNTANSLLVSGALLGMDMRIISPKELQPKAEIISLAQDISSDSGARIKISDDVRTGVKGVDFIYGDVWLSMGESASLFAQRVELLKPYQIDDKVMECTNNEDIKFMHCLPSFHNADTKEGKKLADKFGLENICEVTDSVFESKSSIVFAQAENRMHTIKAVIYNSLSEDVF